MLQNNSFDMDSVDMFPCSLRLEGLKFHSYKDLVALTGLNDLILKATSMLVTDFGNEMCWRQL